VLPRAWIQRARPMPAGPSPNCVRKHARAD
jgi:hypothetical protein